MLENKYPHHVHVIFSDNRQYAIPDLAADAWVEGLIESLEGIDANLIYLSSRHAFDLLRLAELRGRITLSLEVNGKTYPVKEGRLLKWPSEFGKIDNVVATILRERVTKQKESRNEIQ